MKSAYQKGLTLIELIIVMTLVLSLLGIVTINLVGTQRSVSISTTVDTLVADLKSQRIKAMVGETEGRTTTDDYGIYFTATNYVLFHGQAYNPAATDNVTIPLDDSFTFSEVGKSIVFLRLSGNVASFNAAANSITLHDATNNKQKVLRFNKYGTVTTVQ